MLKRVAFAVMAAIAVLTVPLADAKPAAKPVARAVNWDTVVTHTADDGFLRGNPAAPVHLVAYLSFTCPHCAAFEQESDAQLRIGMIIPGKGSYEVRPFLRNGLDLVASLLAECGPPRRFFGNAQAILAKQKEWMAPLDTLTDAQKARWDNPNFAQKMHAIAADLGLYALMEKRGYDRVSLDRCLADKALADRLAKHTNDAAEAGTVKATPTFMLDGAALADTYTWDTLKPQIEARLK